MTCDQCGFDSESFSPADAPAAIRAFMRRYRAPLTRFLPGEDGDAVVRAHADGTAEGPSGPPERGTQTWSALEYAAHVRDVFGAYDERIRLTLAEDRPVFEALDPDAAARDGRYNDQEPVEVVEALATAAEALAATVESVPDDGWERVGLRGDEERTVLATTRTAVHEGNHHLLDIGRVLRSVRAGRAARTVP